MKMKRRETLVKVVNITVSEDEAKVLIRSLEKHKNITVQHFHFLLRDALKTREEVFWVSDLPGVREPSDG